jgi:hypothetical protein
MQANNNQSDSENLQYENQDPQYNPQPNQAPLQYDINGQLIQNPVENVNYFDPNIAYDYSSYETANQNVAPVQVENYNDVNYQNPQDPQVYNTGTFDPNQLNTGDQFGQYDPSMYANPQAQTQQYDPQQYDPNLQYQDQVDTNLNNLDQNQNFVADPNTYFGQDSNSNPVMSQNPYEQNFNPTGDQVNYESVTYPQENYEQYKQLYQGGQDENGVVNNYDQQSYQDQQPQFQVEDNSYNQQQDPNGAYSNFDQQQLCLIPTR